MGAPFLTAPRACPLAEWLDAKQGEGPSRRGHSQTNMMAAFMTEPHLRPMRSAMKPMASWPRMIPDTCRGAGRGVLTAVSSRCLHGARGAVHLQCCWLFCQLSPGAHLGVGQGVGQGLGADLVGLEAPGGEGWGGGGEGSSAGRAGVRAGAFQAYGRQIWERESKMPPKMLDAPQVAGCSARWRSLGVLLGPDALEVAHGEHKVRLSHHACGLGGGEGRCWSGKRPAACQGRGTPQAGYCMHCVQLSSATTVR